MSLPKQMKLMRRKKDVQKFVVKYRNTAVPTKDSFHFSPEHGIFLPGPQTI